MSKQYIGDKQVFGFTKIENKDYDFPLVEVLYKDDSKEIMSEKMKDAIITEESIDASSLREKRMQAVASEALGMLLSYGVKYKELDYLFSLLKKSLEMNYEYANEMLWGKNIYEVNLIDMNTVLKNNGKQEDKNRK